MQEALVRCRGQWWHFFIKPFYGLCFKKSEGTRFLSFEVLLPEACEDFCAIAVGDTIHIVCQNQSGSILHLNLEEDTWHKTVLMESKSKVVQKKYFSLIAMGKYLNLFYIIPHKERHMLVHQILSETDKPPTVVDCLKLQTPPYLIAGHTGTDITVVYENENGLCGSRLYRWSQKAFSRFTPINPSLPCRVVAILAEPGDRIRYAALQSFDDVKNLIYFEKSPEGHYSPAVTIYLDCSDDAAPIFCRHGEKLYLAWQEQGGILSSYSTNDGAKWTKPLRYMQGAGMMPVLYAICDDRKLTSAYGHEKDQEIALYASAPLAWEAKKTEPPAFRPAGYEAAEFARQMGVLVAEEKEGGDPVTTQLRDELFKVKEQVLFLRRELLRLSEVLKVKPTEKSEERERSSTSSNGGIATQENVAKKRQNDMV